MPTIPLRVVGPEMRLRLGGHRSGHRPTLEAEVTDRGYMPSRVVMRGDWTVTREKILAMKPVLLSVTVEADQERRDWGEERYDIRAVATLETEAGRFRLCSPYIESEPSRRARTRDNAQLLERLEAVLVSLGYSPEEVRDAYRRHGKGGHSR